ncbi:major capsid protein [Dipodfec virus RodF1_47]|uniref:Major capsid protein n=1 Tax=Dipodfec virus RodF1_47 TaxID=2929298 RepID=A0A976N2S0_9VIRU|nr:major capsid protein [Dipodfec virus RodF1_47]
MVNTSMPLSTSEVFSRVPKSSAVTYSTFDRSHRHLTAIDASYCYPILVDDVLPGDIFSLEGRHLNRLLTPIKPFMDNLRARYFYFYCPSRLVWNNWKAFMGEKKRPDSTPKQYQVPMLNSGATGVEVGSIFDYAGIPTGVPNLEFCALPFRAMNLVYNEWLRDENLGDWLQVGGTGSTEQELEDNEFGDSDQLSNYKLFRIAKPHDYFTSGLPQQQLGSAMSLSIGSMAPVKTGSPIITDSMTGMVVGRANGAVYTDGNNYALAVNQQANGYGSINAFGPAQSAGLSAPIVPRNLYADLTEVTGFTISDFRTAMQLQALKELNMRMGHRYKEIIYGEFDVMVSDATLDRPEFLGSYSLYFNTIPVASTAESGDNPQGNLSAFSYTDNSPRHGFTKAFEEHGYVIGFCVVQTDQTYQQGLNRMWSRKNKYDFYTPLLADISEQSVKMKEILAQGSDVMSSDGTTPVDETTFTFQEAWAEYRYKPNMVSGKMRSTAQGTLDVWHLAAKYAPSVIEGQNVGIPFNDDFIRDNTRETLERVLAVKGEPQIESDNYFNLRCTREMPIYSVPAYLTGRL